MSQLQEKPWYHVWIHPKEMMPTIIVSTHKIGFFLFSCLAGWPIAIQIAQAYALSTVFSLPYIILLSIFSAPAFGALWFVIMGGILYLTGKWFKGKASFKEVRYTLAWSSGLMWFFLFITSAFLLIHYGASWFCPNWINMPASPTMVYVAFCLWLTHLIIIVWTICVLVHALAAIQGFSWKRSLGNIALSGVIVWGIIRALS